jgi:predicted permease
MNDIRLAIRALRSTPILSVVAVLSLTLGIGANTAIFAIVDTLLLRTLPVKAPGRLVMLAEAGSNGQQSWTYPIWQQIHQRPELFEDAFAWSSTRFNLAPGGQSELVDGIWASGGIFETLGVDAMLGRTFTDADDVRGGGPDGPVGVISYEFWQRRFGGAADAIGRTLNVERVPVTIIGVTPPDFFGPEVGRTFDVIVPLGVEPLVRGKETWLDGRSTWWLGVMARLKPGQSAESATQALVAVQPQIRQATHPGWSGYLEDAFTLRPAASGDSSLRRRYERPLIMLLIIVALVLVIACANIANLLLARATARRHELSVRLALGASRWRLARLLLAESLVLSIAGAAFGVLVAIWGSRLLVAQLSTTTSRVFLDLRFDWRIFAFTVGATVATTLLFGTVPALRAAAIAPMEAIKEQGRGAVGDVRGIFANGLVIAQVALSVVLVVGAGLFVRTFASLATLQLGFDRDRVLVVNINSQRAAIPRDERIATYERVHDAARTLPGVAGAALSVITPVSGRGWNNMFDVSGTPSLTGRQSSVFLNAITPDWLATLRTPLLEGRQFMDRDRKGAPLVGIVNQAFARRFLNGGSPIGRIVKTRGIPGLKKAPPPPREIVGLVADAVYRNLREPVPPTMYIPLAQLDEDFALPSIALSVRSSTASPASLTRSVTASIAGVSPDLALTFRPLSDFVDAALTQERLVATLSGFFGSLALLLAALGLYGVTSYAVHRRRTEIGIRMALGAAPAGVVRLVLRRVAWLVGAGVVAGALVSIWAARFVEALLWGLTPNDPVTLIAACIVLPLVGGLATWVPAWRASHIDPARVLRQG